MTDRLLAHRAWGTPAEAGSSAAVLLLNGGMMTYDSWQPVVEGLGRPCLGCDFRGQLLSPGPAPTDLEGHLDDLVRLLDHIRPGPLDVIGTSFGGEVAVLLAALHPRRVRALALVTAADRTPASMPASVERLRGHVRRILKGGDSGPFHDELVREVYSESFLLRHAETLRKRRGQDLPAAWFEGLLGILQAVERFDLRPYLGAIRCPTLVVGAENDSVMPRPRVEALARGIAGAELAMHPSSGHALASEDPAWLAERCRRFFDSLPTDNRG